MNCLGNLSSVLWRGSRLCSFGHLRHVPSLVNVPAAGWFPVAEFSALSEPAPGVQMDVVLIRRKDRIFIKQICAVERLNSIVYKAL